MAPPRTLLALLQRDDWVLRSPLPLAACADRLRDAVPDCPFVQFGPLSPGGMRNGICGEVSGDRFHLRRLSRQNYPVADGRFAPEANGTRVEVRVATPLLFPLTLALVLAGFGLGWLVTLSVLAARPDPEALRHLLIATGAVGWAALVLGIGMVPDAIAVKCGYAAFLRDRLVAEVVAGPAGAALGEEPRVWWWRLLGW